MTIFTNECSVNDCIETAQWAGFIVHPLLLSNLRTTCGIDSQMLWQFSKHQNIGNNKTTDSTVSCKLFATSNCNSLFKERHQRTVGQGDEWTSEWLSLKLSGAREDLAMLAPWCPKTMSNKIMLPLAWKGLTWDVSRELRKSGLKVERAFSQKRTCAISRNTVKVVRSNSNTKCDRRTWH